MILAKAQQQLLDLGAYRDEFEPNRWVLIGSKDVHDKGLKIAMRNKFRFRSIERGGPDPWGEQIDTHLLYIYFDGEAGGLMLRADDKGDDR